MNKPLKLPKIDRSASAAPSPVRPNGSPAKCSFNFKIPGDPAAIMDMVRPLIVEGGGTVSGEGANVAFSIPTVVGRFNGVCTAVEPTLVNIAVHEKPDVISCKVIRDQLTKQITLAVRMYNAQIGSATSTPGETSHG